jgi:hypothetical protein
MVFLLAAKFVLMPILAWVCSQNCAYIRYSNNTRPIPPKKKAKCENFLTSVISADRNLNPHKGIHTPHTCYDFVPDAIHGVVGMQELS